MVLEYGKRYRATIRLGWLESAATDDMIRVKFVEVGFASVSVGGSGRERHAEGTWTLATRNVTDLPEQVTHVEAIP